MTQVHRGFSASTCAFALVLALANRTAIAQTATPVPSPSAQSSAAPTAPHGSMSHWDFADDNSLPIELRHDSAIVDTSSAYVVVSASVNGKVGTFLLDTGASGMVLGQGFTSSLDLKSRGRASLTGVAGNHIGAGVVVIDDLGFGKNVLHAVVADVASDDAASVGRHLDGIIGYSLFEKAIVDVDLSAQQMRIFDPARFEPTVTKQSYVFDIDLTNRVPIISGSVGKVAIHPILDSGNSLLLNLSYQLQQDGKLLTGATFNQYFRGVDGMTEAVPCARVNRVSFGAINYDGTIVCFPKGQIFGKDGGIVGFDFLRHFNWTVDYPDKKFVLTPNGF